MIDPPLRKERTALLSVDFQNDIAKAGGLLAPSDPDALERYAVAIERAERALSTARSLDLLVAHVRVAFAPGHPGANRHTGPGRFIADQNALLEESDGADFVSKLAPTDGELVVTKRMVSAFEGTDLEQQLRARDIDTVVVMGLVTHFAVEGTVRSAADRGYRVVTLGDCCASGSDERHRAALDLLGFLGPVIQSSQLASSVSSTAAR